jgi:tRNA threonylcarbamoyladenosine biosynthesis protein TsaE
MQIKAQIRNLEELDQLAIKLSEQIICPALVLLEGELGAGKTTFVKAYGKHLGIAERTIKSPTFSIINIYKISTVGQINHVDLYRLEKPDLLIEEEIKELTVIPEAITFIEWGERISDIKRLNKNINLYKIKFDLKQDNLREICFQNYQKT